MAAKSYWNDNLQKILESKDNDGKGKKLQIKQFDYSLTTDDLYVAIVDSMIDEKGLNGHHLESADEFYKNGVKEIITKGFDIQQELINQRSATDEDKSIDYIKCEVKFTDVKLHPPTTLNYNTSKETLLMPQVALLDDKIYSGPMYLSCEIKATAHKKDGTTVEKTDKLENFRAARVPIIKGSILCNTYRKTKEALASMGEDPSDPGGYFIVKSEWAVDCTESTPFNKKKIFINEGYAKSRVRLDYISKPGDAYQNSDMIIIVFNRDDTLTVEISRDKLMKVDIPFYLLFRAIGWSDDKEMMDWIVRDYDAEANQGVLNYVRAAMNAKYGKNNYRTIYDQEEAIKAIVDLIPRENFKYLNLDEVPANYTIAAKSVLRIFDSYFLPHIGLTSDSRHSKLKFLALLIRKLLLVYLRQIPETDRDSYVIKRIHSAGDNYAKTFKTLFNQTIAGPIKRSMQKLFNSTPFSHVNLANMVKNSIYVDDFERLIVQTIISGNKSNLKIKSGRMITNRLMAQQLNRKNQLNMYATMRQISSTSADSAKQSERAQEMRRVHASSLGYICLIHSPPEGEKVGINKQMAISASIAPPSSSEVLKKILAADPMIIPEERPTPLEISKNNYGLVYVNGYLIGYTENSIELVNKYRRKRRLLEIHPYTTIYWDNAENEVEFFVDTGRIVRPLAIVYNTKRDSDIVHKGGKGGKGGKGDKNAVADNTVVGNGADSNVAESKNIYSNVADTTGGKDSAKNHTDHIKFEQGVAITKQDIIDLYCKRKGLYDLVAEQKIEFITPEEQQNCYICASLDMLYADRHDELKEYTHVDVPQAILGITALTAPFGNHNQAPRVTYQTSQSKQTCGFYAGNWPYRIDKETFLQYVSEMPLIRTVMNKYIFPNGNNCVVAMTVYAGYNQEDSLVVSRAAVERGLFDGSKFTFEKTELEQKEQLGNPDVTKTENIKSANYSKLVKGVVERGTHIQEDDVLIGKMLSVSKGTGRDAVSIYVDRSIVYRDSEPAIVQRVVVDRNEDAMRFAKVGLRKIRPLAVGDKLCLRSGVQVLTEHGWQRIDDIDIKSVRIATMDPITHTLQYKYAARKYNYDYDGELYYYKSESYFTVCTPNHKNYVKFRKDGDTPIAQSGPRSPTSSSSSYSYNDGTFIASNGASPAMIPTIVSGTTANRQMPPLPPVSAIAVSAMMSNSIQSLFAPSVKIHQLPYPTKSTYGFVSAEECYGKRIEFKNDCIGYAKTKTSVYERVPDITPLTIDSYLRLLAMYIYDGFSCEGSICISLENDSLSDSRKVDEYANISSKQTKKKVAQILYDLGINTNSICTRSISCVCNICRDNSQNVRLVGTCLILNANKPILTHIAEQSGIPNYIWDLSQDHARTFIEYFIGKSIPNRLIDVMQRLCLHAGYQYCLINGTLQIEQLKTRKYVEKWINYKGIVTCLEIDDTHLFYYRENELSLPMWTGNSSRSGQKGIASMLLREADMPTTESGIRPDILFNPHGLPSRMTIGQLMESLIGNICAIEGSHYDGTMFKKNDIESCAEILEQYGFHRYGYERLINGITGEYMNVLIFVGMTYYQRLQKFVSDAEYAVSRALTDALTAQPLDGQASAGGLRIGEMERDVLVVHGVSRFLHEKFFHHSDGYTEYICKCGRPIIVNHRESIYKCKFCKDNAEPIAVRTSWSAKLAAMEIMSCNVGLLRVPRPPTYQIMDTEQRTLSKIENYSKETLNKLWGQFEDMVDNNAAVEHDD